MNPDCAVCGRAERSIFSSLEPELFAELSAASSVHRFPAGEKIVALGAPALAVYCVMSGTVKLTRLGEKGDRQVLRLLGSADVFGLRPILAENDFAVTATVLETCTICIMPKATVLDMLQRSSRFALRVMKYLAQEIRLSEDFLMVLTQRPVRRRVADLLLLLHGHDIRGDDWEPLRVRSLKRKEMAEAIGATPETLSRVLAEFAKQGLIEVNRREIKLLDLDALQIVASDKVRKS